MSAEKNIYYLIYLDKANREMDLYSFKYVYSRIKQKTISHWLSHEGND